MKIDFRAWKIWKTNERFEESIKFWVGVIYYSVSGENDEESLNVTLRQLQDVHKAEIKIRQNSSKKMYALYVFDGNAFLIYGKCDFD